MLKNLSGCRRDAARAAGNGFRGKAAALLVSSAMGLGACGDEIHDHYIILPQDGGADGNVTVVVEPPQVTVVMPADAQGISGLCGDAPSIPVLYDKTLNVGEAALLVNGYRLFLSDLETQSQTAFFHLTDDENLVLGHVDMPEGVEGTMDLGDGPVRLAACSVRAGYRFEESSVTLRADAEIEREPSVCGEETFESGTGQTLENGIFQDVDQLIRIDTCEERPPTLIIQETASLEPGLEAGEGGNGLAVNMRLTVFVLGETFTIVGLRPDGIDLGKESISGRLEAGESLPLAPGLDLSLAFTEAHDGVLNAVLDVIDETGMHYRMDPLVPGSTMAIDFAASRYLIHAYAVGDGSAEIAVLSGVVPLNDPGNADFEAGTYGFSMEWGAGNRVVGWEFQKE